MAASAAASGLLFFVGDGERLVGMNGGGLSLFFGLSVVWGVVVVWVVVVCAV